MSDVWQRALSPTPHVVLGLPLQPLTLGHVFLLSKCDSALLDDDRSPNLQDIILAAFVCAQPWRDSERDMARRSFKWFCAWWGWKCRKANWQIEAKLFDAYLSEALAMPEFRPKGDGKLVDRQSPWFWRLAVLAMTAFPHSWAEAMDMGVARLNLLWLAKAEMDDQITIQSAASESFWDWCVARDKERIKN